MKTRLAAGPWFLPFEAVRAMASGDLEAIRAELGRHDDIKALQAVAVDTPGRMSKEGHIRIRGPLGNDGGFFAMMMGQASYDEIGDTIRAMDADPNIDPIVIDVDSVGGGSDGIQIVREAIKACETQVIVRITGKFMSAAVWAFAGADRIEIATSGRAGCLGAMVVEYRRGDSDDTVKPVIHRSRRAQNKNAPLDTPEGLAELRSALDDNEDVMLTEIADDRGLDVEDMVSAFKNGGCLTGVAVIAAGLADGLIGEHSNHNPGHGPTSTQESAMFAFQNHKALPQGMVAVALADIEAANKLKAQLEATEKANAALQGEKKDMAESLASATSSLEAASAELTEIKAARAAEQAKQAEQARKAGLADVLQDAKAEGRIPADDPALEASLVEIAELHEKVAPGTGNAKLKAHLEKFPRTHAAGDGIEGHTGNPDGDGPRMVSQKDVDTEISEIAKSQGLTNAAAFKVWRQNNPGVNVR